MLKYFPAVYRRYSDTVHYIGRAVFFLYLTFTNMMQQENMVHIMNPVVMSFRGIYPG